VLGYPFCFKSCGFVLATLMMCVVLVATRISYQLMLYCADLSGRRTYESIAEQVLGKAGRTVLELCTAALNLGAIVAYLNILADVLSSVAGTIIPPGAEPSRHTYITGAQQRGTGGVHREGHELGLLFILAHGYVSGQMQRVLQGLLTQCNSVCLACMG
jgi:sodium-coupled neutral amino acid transporter 10